jgi:hypothetical protein
MTADELAKALAQQQAAGKVSILAAVEAADGGTKPWFADLLLGSLMLSGGDLVVAADTAPGQSGERVTLGGSAALLNMEDVPVALTFTVPPTGRIELEIGIVPATWRMAQSFPALVGDPIDGLTLTDVLLLFSTRDGQPISWKAPDGTDPQLTTQQGLNLVSAIDVAATFGALTGFLDHTGSAVFSGSIVPPLPTPPQGLPYPGLDLSGTIGTSPPQIPHFPLGLPRIALRTPLNWGDPGTPFPIAQVSLTLDVAGVPLEFWGMRILGTGSVLLHAETAPGKIISPAAIVESLLAGTAYDHLIPDELSSVFSAAGLKSAAVLLDLESAKVSAVSVDIAVEDVALGPITLQEIVGRFLVDDPGGPTSQSLAAIRAQFSFLPTVFTGAFFAEAYRTGDTTGFSGGYQGEVTLGALLAAASDNAIVAPAALAQISFNDFGASFVKGGGASWDWTLYGTLNLLHQVVVAGVVISAELQAIVTSTGGAKAYLLGGGLEIGGEIFSAQIEFGATEKRLIANWTNVGTPLGLNEIAAFFGWDMPALPEGLDLGLQQASLFYDFTTDELAVSAVSANYGTLVFASIAPSAGGTERLHVVALEPGWNPGLSDLPLIGPQLPTTNAPGIANVQILAASAAVDADMPTIAALFAAVEAQPPVPQKLASGVTIAAMLQGVGGDSRSLVLPLSGPSSSGDGVTTSDASAPSFPSGGPAPSSATPPPAPAYGGATTWFSVDKTIGPATLRRVGIQYQDQKLGVLLDASATFGSLTLGLDGLGLVSPLKSFSPLPTLSGLEVAFSTGPVDVAGGLLRLADGSFAGDLTVKIEPYLISAIGAFGEVDGQKAFFVFANVEGEFGGPPAFFITGFLAGLGHNYALTIPSADQVHNFPFLAGMDDPGIVGGKNAGPLDVLQALATPPSGAPWITRTAGAKWIAAGVDFRSFELIYGRAMVAVVEGRDFEIALLGLAHMSLPKGAGSDAYAYVELQLDAALKPADGTFSVIASLTPNSYLLTHDCHLTGGFAFCLWFGDNTHSGDFVVTAGGYHPAFTVPTWYPQVDRVGFNWAVGSDVTVKGGAYFALTPTAAMAGGSLEVLFQSGDLKAWFTAYADLMIRWKPFYFTADIGVSIGASYRLNLAFTSVTLSVELGATLALHGPPTGGVVHVHWTVISFSVSFGADPPPAAALILAWPEFQALLPQKAATASAPTPSPTEIHVARGLVRNDSRVGWIVRADEVILVTSCKIPSTELHAGSAKLTPPTGAATTLNIRPMQLADVASAHKVSLTLADGDQTIDLDLAVWRGEPITATLPSALWGEPLAVDGAGAVVDPPVTADLIANLQTGIRLTAPAATEGAAVGPFDVASVLDPLGGGYLPLDVPHQGDPTARPTPNPQSIGLIRQTLANAASATARQALLATLDPASQPPTCAPLNRLAAAADRLFAEPPMCSGSTGHA